MHQDPTPGGHQPLDVEVELRYRNLRPFPARARRIWATGMALETSRMRLPAGTPVDLQFHVAGRPYQLAAVVEESCPDALILRFDSAQHALWRQAAAPASLGLRPAPYPQAALN